MGCFVREPHSLRTFHAKTTARFEKCIDTGLHVMFQTLSHLVRHFGYLLSPLKLKIKFLININPNAKALYTHQKKRIFLAKMEKVQGKDKIYTINASVYTWRLMYRTIRNFKTKK